MSEIEAWSRVRRPFFEASHRQHSRIPCAVSRIGARASPVTSNEDLDMLSRIALFISSLVAASVLAIGISMAAGSAATDMGPKAAVDAASLADGASSTPRVQVDTVYVPAPIPPKTITVHRNVPPAGSGDDANEGSEE